MGEGENGRRKQLLKEHTHEERESKGREKKNVMTAESTVGDQGRPM